MANKGPAVFLGQSTQEGTTSTGLHTFSDFFWKLPLFFTGFVACNASPGGILRAWSFHGFSTSRRGFLYEIFNEPFGYATPSEPFGAQRFPATQPFPSCIWRWRIQKTGNPKWVALVSGNMDQNLPNPSSLIWSHTHIAGLMDFDSWGVKVGSQKLGSLPTTRLAQLDAVWVVVNFGNHFP